MTDIKDHLRNWQRLESDYSRLEADETDMTERYRILKQAKALLITEEKLKIEELMKITGEYEVDIDGDITDYRVGYSSPRDKLDIHDESAVPPKFIRIKEEKSVMKKELLDHLRALPDEKRPNYASVGKSKSELYWKAVKKKHKGDK